MPSIGQIKGALLEYLVRQILDNCGFTNIKPDNLYSFRDGDKFMVNGRGAAHDADVIMDPPVQMPFHYPTRLLFECKAYKAKASLPIVRNALGLRNDINEFEIVTKDSIKKSTLPRQKCKNFLQLPVFEGIEQEMSEMI